MSFKADSISKFFGDRQVLDRVSMHCHPGEIRALIGPNGAGKTTFFKIILGLLKPDGGEVQWEEGHQKRFGAIVEKPAFYPYLSASENLRLFGALQGLHLSKLEITHQLDAVGLSTDRKDGVRNYSMGMKQRLGIAIALLGDPGVLVLDEPFSGLDPMGIRDLSNLLQNLAQVDGKAIVISSHFMDQLVRFCDHITVMSEGKVISEGSSYKLLNNHTKRYRLEGPRLKQSKVLSDLKLAPESNRVIVYKETISSSELLSRLAEEGIEVTACIPLLEIDQIMNPSS